MPPEKSFELRTTGSLHLKTTSPTLAQIEAFCAEARRLGLRDNETLYTSRQGLMGPINGWYFVIPVVPKEVPDGNDNVPTVPS